ncbi:MAG: hypothetical protein UMV23_06765 [Halanaerobium sp.]|nr:hypothetical protein [Halanaerobium sp.]
MQNRAIVIFLFGLLLASFIWVPGIQASEEYELPPWPEGWSREEVVSGKIDLNTLEFNFARGEKARIYYLHAQGRVSNMDLELFTYQPHSGYEQVVRLERNAYALNFLQIAIDREGRKRLVWTEEKRREDYSKYYLLYYACLAENNKFLVKPQQIIESDDPILNVRAELDESSLLHLIWAGREGATYAGYHLALQADGRMAMAPLAIISNSSYFNRGEVYVAEGGLLHLAWTQVEEDGEHLYYGIFDKGRSLVRKPVDFGMVSLFSDTKLSGQVVQLERCFPAIDGFNGRVVLVWNQIPEDSRSYFNYNIFLQQFDRQGNMLGDRLSLSSYRNLSSHPDVLTQKDRIAIAWHEVMGDYSHIFYSLVNYRGEIIQARTRLDVKKASAMRPQIVSGDGDELIMLWHRVDRAGAFLVSKNTIYPEKPSVWYRIGLQEKQAVQSLVYVFFTSLFLAFAYSLPGLVLVVIGFFVLILLSRYMGDRLLDDNFILSCGVIFSLISLLLETPLYFYRPYIIPAGLKWVTFILTSVTAIVFFARLRRQARWSGIKSSLGKLLICYGWVYLYTFYLTIPSIIDSMSV